MVAGISGLWTFPRVRLLRDPGVVPTLFFQCSEITGDINKEREISGTDTANGATKTKIQTPLKANPMCRR